MTTTIRTDASVLDGLEAKVCHLEREIAGMRAEVRAAYTLIRDVAFTVQHVTVQQSIPAVVTVQDPIPLTTAPTPEAAESGTLDAFLRALALDHASLTGAKPVTPETVRANILHASPRFKAFRGLYDRAGVKNLLAEASAREWLAGEDPAAPGHTRYAVIMSGLGS